MPLVQVWALASSYWSPSARCCDTTANGEPVLSWAVADLMLRVGEEPCAERNLIMNENPYCSHQAAEELLSMVSLPSAAVIAGVHARQSLQAEAG